MVGWHYWFDGLEFEQTQADSDGVRNLECCSSWGHKVGHDLVTQQQQLIYYGIKNNKYLGINLTRKTYLSKCILKITKTCLREIKEDLK